MQHQSDPRTTLTTKDLYRKSIMEQYDLINRQKVEVFQRETPPEIAQGVMGVYWSICSLKNMLYSYIHEKIDNEGKLHATEDYTKSFNAISLDFEHLLNNPTMVTIRQFMGGLNSWMDLLSYYFAEVGLLPKKRETGTLATSEILHIESLEHLGKAIKRLIPEEKGKEMLEYIDQEVKKDAIIQHDIKEEI